MSKAKYDYLWLRLGDAAEYQEFGQDISALVDELFEHRIDAGKISWLKCPRNPEAYAKKNKLTYLPPSGFIAPCYEGQNYVSLFWSDKTGEGPWQPLTRSEQKIIVDRLDRLTQKADLPRHIEYLEWRVEQCSDELARFQKALDEAHAKLRSL